MAVLWEPSFNDETTKWVDVARELNVKHFAGLAAELDRDQRYPWESVEKLIDSGITGLMLPKEFGGEGASLPTGVAVMEELSRACASTAAVYAIYALGSGPIVAHGTDAQKDFYLREIRAGRPVSFALTERGAGSDPAALAATGVQDGDGWRLRGEKIFIGNGGASKHYVAFVVTDPELGPRGITAFMTGLDDPGTAVTKYADRMGLRGTQTSNLELDTQVPADRMIGERGRGLRIALAALNSGRVIIAAQALGIAIAAFEHAATEATRRQTFGRPIFDNQAISFPLADLATRISAARMLTWEAAHADDDTERGRTLASMAKLYATQVSHDAVDVAVQVFGGDGYCKPNPVERLYRDQRILEIYEGSSEVQRLSLARSISGDVARGLLKPLQPMTTAYGHKPF